MLATYFAYPTEPLTLEVEPALETLQYVYIQCIPSLAIGGAEANLESYI